MRGLRVFLILDAAILFWVGVAFIFAPGPVARAFGFFNLPAGGNYILAMWGCVFATMAGGYAIAATNPIRHLIWIQVGIARGILEVLVGLSFILRGLVTWNQAAFGVFAAGALALAYIILYPRPVSESVAAGEEETVER